MTKKRQNFVRLANARVSKAIKAIQIVGNLSNAQVYDYSARDVEKIFGALNQALRDSRARFGGSRGSDKPLFELE